MLKTIVTILLSIVFSVLAARGFASQLEVVSATRAKDKGKRSLELGITGRAIISAIFSVVFIVLMISSNIRILAVILGILLSVGMVILNVYLRKHEIKLLPSFFLLWVATVISTSTYAHFTSKDTLGTVYIVLQIICLVLILLGAAVPNLLCYYDEYKREEQDPVKKNKADDSEADEEDEEENTDGEDWPEDELRRERLYENAIKISLLVGFIAIAVILAVILEVKFDFLPPYRF